MIAAELPDLIEVFETSILPPVPAELLWAPGWCYRCHLVRDVAPAGTMVTRQGIELELGLCRWHWAETERDMLAVVEHHRFPTLRDQFGRLARWAGTLARLRS
ncbi:hypothetical protein [Kitasatospora sp. NPDC059673]|uniref:hypothetical protein n=1 Tax=Kitasatospora sp. NPDC059673 TaxID=3346901 RepID=UPI003676FA1F